MAQRLGQHFLKDKSALEKIVNALDIKDGDFVLEIGAGHGELTEQLRVKSASWRKALRINAIETDQRFADLLKEKFAGDKNIEIIHGDALKVLPQMTISQTLNSKPYKIVGNLPYYITGYLFRILADLESKPEIIVFTIQKEVAERIMALRQAQGKQKMNLLAASIQFWAKPEIIDFIPKTAFKPKPKVDSAIIKLTPIPQTLNPKPYYAFIKILFKQPRKTILNNLSAGFEKSKSEIEEILKQNNINPSDRPQNLTISQIIMLSTQQY